jgi:hypothetical protein
MPKSKTYQIRIDEKDKQETFQVFAELGITLTTKDGSTSHVTKENYVSI